jgi:hypothetical protein
VLAAAHPVYRSRDFTAAAAELGGAVSSETREGMIGDLVALMSELSLNAALSRIFEPPGRGPMRREEFLFLSAIAAMQAGDIARGVTILTDMLQVLKVGRLLVPMKFLATRLQLEHVLIVPIGERSFTVVASNAQSNTLSVRRASLFIAQF